MSNEALLRDTIEMLREENGCLTRQLAALSEQSAERIRSLMVELEALREAVAPAVYIVEDSQGLLARIRKHPDYPRPHQLLPFAVRATARSVWRVEHRSGWVKLAPGEHRCGSMEEFLALRGIALADIPTAIPELSCEQHTQRGESDGAVPSKYVLRYTVPETGFHVGAI